MLLTVRDYDLYHAKEKTANNNAGKPLCIRRYPTQHSHDASCAKDSRQFYGVV